MLPYMALFLVLSGTGFICDSVIRRRLLSVLAVRKLVTVVGKFLMVDLCDLSRDMSLYIGKPSFAITFLVTSVTHPSYRTVYLFE